MLPEKSTLLPGWVPELWRRSDAHRRMMVVLDSLTPDQAHALLMHLQSVEPWHVTTAPGPTRPQ